MDQEFVLCDFEGGPVNGRLMWVRPDAGGAPKEHVRVLIDNWSEAIANVVPYQRVGVSEETRRWVYTPAG
jgi:hypothetical protein